MAVARGISLMWLILLTFIAVLPFGVLFFFAIKGMRRLRQLAKQALPIAQQKARLVADGTGRVSQKVAAPVIGVRAGVAQVQGIRRATFRRKQA